jgi:hypothetical protein
LPFYLEKPFLSRWGALSSSNKLRFWRPILICIRAYRGADFGVWLPCVNSAFFLFAQAHVPGNHNSLDISRRSKTAPLL